MAKLEYFHEPNKISLSYSTRQTLKSCPRKFKLQTMFNFKGQVAEKGSVDFAFGHAVAMGVQMYLTTKDTNIARTAMLAEWDIDFDAENPKAKKSLAWAIQAFEFFLVQQAPKLEGDWEVATFNIDGKEIPAVELLFVVDIDESHTYQGHVDLVLRHKETGVFLVLELKTTSLGDSVHEAMYGNSDQALGYSIIIDCLVRKFTGAIGSYSVLYLVYKTSKFEWWTLPLTKSSKDRASFLLGLLTDVHMINYYKAISFFPKNGAACYEFFRPCEYYGSCDISDATLEAHKARLDALHADGKQLATSNFAQAAKVDFRFSLADLLDMQMAQVAQLTSGDAIDDPNSFMPFEGFNVGQPQEDSSTSEISRLLNTQSSQSNDLIEL